jgi:hypothetical protein
MSSSSSLESDSSFFTGGRVLPLRVLGNAWEELLPLVLVLVGTELLIVLFGEPAGVGEDLVFFGVPARLVPGRTSFSSGSSSPARASKSLYLAFWASVTH